MLAQHSANNNQSLKKPLRQSWSFESLVGIIWMCWLGDEMLLVTVQEGGSRGPGTLFSSQAHMKTARLKYLFYWSDTIPVA